MKMLVSPNEFGIFDNNSGTRESAFLRGKQFRKSVSGVNLKNPLCDCVFSEFHI